MSFPKEFLWGVATSAYQIEGAAGEGGKGASVWDRFSKVPGRIADGSTGERACDHFHLFREDVALMADLGIPCYRFSLSWPRLLPDGRGRLSPDGAAFYDRLIDALLEKGIRPFVTLFHWDYPCALAVRGGWASPDSPEWFADYAALCARSFGDRVLDFITINEPQCFIGLGHVTGEHAPGLRLPPSETVPMGHHVLRAHALAVQALRAEAPGCRVGYAPCGNPAIPQTPADVDAARRAYFSMPRDAERWYWNVSWWSDPVMLGRYPEDGLALYGRYLPPGWEKDLDSMCQPLEYYGQNIYNGYPVRASDAPGGWEEAVFPQGAPRTAAGWPVTPEALYWGPRFLYERYRTPILITENGMSCHDAVSLDGQVHDPNRIDYLSRYLAAYRRAAHDGVNAAGYFAWSLMDNFEWSLGYTQRFGLVYVDYQTLRRIPKDSARWYAETIRSNGEHVGRVEPVSEENG